jgi:hypothetical protein
VKHGKARIALDRLRMAFNRRLGLWLAEMALGLTGNRAYRAVVREAPAILARRFLISTEPIDQSRYGPSPGSEWLVWGQSSHPKEPRMKQGRQQAGEIEVTPAMVDAGIDVFLSYGSDDWEVISSCRLMIGEIIEAALRARRLGQAGEPGQDLGSGP